MSDISDMRLAIRCMQRVDRIQSRAMVDRLRASRFFRWRFLRHARALWAFRTLRMLNEMFPKRK